MLYILSVNFQEVWIFQIHLDLGGTLLWSSFAWICFCEYHFYHLLRGFIFAWLRFKSLRTEGWKKKKTSTHFDLRQDSQQFKTENLCCKNLRNKFVLNVFTKCHNFTKINLCKWLFQKPHDDKLLQITKFYNILKNLSHFKKENDIGI